MAELISYSETTQILQDFLEVAFQTILRQRGVYPASIFEERKKYDVVVWQSRNPDLNAYLGGCTSAIGEELAKGNVKKVALVIKEATLEENPLERFLFDFTWLIPFESITKAKGQDFTPAEGGMLRSHVDHHLRGFMKRLGTANSYLGQLPSDITFTVIIELNNEAPPPLSVAEIKENVPAQWAPAAIHLTSESTSEIDTSSSSYSTRPVRTPLQTSRLGMMNLQMSVEEYAARSETVTPTLQFDRKGKGRA